MLNFYFGRRFERTPYKMREMISILVILSLSVVFSASEDKTVDGICNPGWRRFENKCYGIFTKTKEKNFQEATAYCQYRQPDSTLITIKSREVLDFITAELGKLNVGGAVLIGLKRPFRDSRHKWVDGTDLEYENWAEGEPNNCNRNEACAQMEASGAKAGQWNDIPCDVPKGIVCQAEPEQFEKKELVEGSCPYKRQLLGKMIDVGSANCYFLNLGVAGFRSFDGARAECQKFGADLAIFETRRELKQLRPYLLDNNHPYFWVGISSRSRSNGDFRTLNEGKPITRDMWIYGEPNLLDIEKCAALLGPNTGLYNFQCSYVHNFICQIAKVAADGEASTLAPKPCGFDQFRCDNGKCKPAIYRCDFVDDCDDGSDERDCQYSTTTIKPIECSADQFKCGDGNCIPARHLCDHDTDCDDGSDESLDICTENQTCHQEKFSCGAYGKCIDQSSVCDGTDDCENGKDEEGCEFSECMPEQFRCENSSACILLGSRCDGIDDCGDNSDEIDCGNYTSIVTVADESTTTEMNVIDILGGSHDDNSTNEILTENDIIDKEEISHSLFD